MFVGLLVPSGPAVRLKKKKPGSIVYNDDMGVGVKRAVAPVPNSTATKKYNNKKTMMSITGINFFPLSLYFIYFFLKGGLLSLFPPPL